MSERHPITGCRADTLLNQIWFINDWLDCNLPVLLSYDLIELKKLNDEEAERIRQEEATRPADQPPPKPYVVQDKVAIIPVHGPTTKYPTSFQALFGGASTILVERQLRVAAADSDVKAIAMHFESPGGTAAGASELSQAIEHLNKIKPIYAHVEDLGCSAVNFFTAPCTRVTANRSATMGSIGTLSALVDTSDAYKKEGIRKIPVVSGRLKMTGMPGTKVTPEMVAMLQNIVDNHTKHFFAVVGRGRGLSDKYLQKLEAAVFPAEDAFKHHLIDEIADWPQVLEQIQKDKVPTTANRGPVSVTNIPAAPPRRNAMALTPSQLQRIRQISGAADVTEENAEDRMMQLIERQHDQLQQTRIDERLATGHIRQTLRDFEFLSKTGKLQPVQLEAVKGLLMNGDKAKIEMVAPNGTVMLPAEQVVSLLENNKPDGIQGEQTDAQVVDRKIPGTNKSESAGGKVTLESLNRSREARGLAPVEKL